MECRVIEVEPYKLPKGYDWLLIERSGELLLAVSAAASPAKLAADIWSAAQKMIQQYAGA